MNRFKGIQVVLVMLLFLTFAFGSFFVLAFGSDAYKRNINRIDDAEKCRLPLAYLTTKVREARNADSVDIKEIEGRICLTISESIEDDDYLTYIFYEDGYIYELFQQSERVGLKGSERVLAVEGLHMEKDDGVIIFETGGERAMVCLH